MTRRPSALFCFLLFISSPACANAPRCPSPNTIGHYHHPRSHFGVTPCPPPLLALAVILAAAGKATSLLSLATDLCVRSRRLVGSGVVRFRDAARRGGRCRGGGLRVFADDAPSPSASGGGREGIAATCGDGALWGCGIFPAFFLGNSDDSSWTRVSDVHIWGSNRICRHNPWLSELPRCRG